MAVIPGFKAFVEPAAGVLVMLTLSHGHLDHIMRLREFDEVWIHPEDEALLHGAYGMPVYEGIPERIHHLQHGDIIDLGNRLIDVYNIKGHTNGSLLFLDRQTKTLFFGDTIARRLLYGISGWIPLDEFAAALMDMGKQDFDGILSAHDCMIIPKSHIQDMIAAIRQADETTTRVSLLDVDFIQVIEGDENQTKYQDITILAGYLDLVKTSVRRLKEDTERDV